MPPAPRRAGLSWQGFLRAKAGAVLTCDFFTVNSVWLKQLYVMFFIELASRRVFLAGCTEQPTAAWVTQQARNLSWELGQANLRPRSYRLRTLPDNPNKSALLHVSYVEGATDQARPSVSGARLARREEA